MNINLQIERIILDDIDIPRSQLYRLQAALETELSRLLNENNLPSHLQNGGNISSLPTTVNITKDITPEQIGVQIAQSVFRGIMK
ncbi:MAG: hypothetical protein KI793_23260 [Rivularia sp. (in: Bacteria)]|nr:hypothetical protein [Rivularia sp. MS3]